jgi:hypothetical protein
MIRVACSVLAIGVLTSCGPESAASADALRVPGARASFDDGVARIAIGEHTVRIALASIGREGAMRDVGPGRIDGGERVEIVRDALPGVIEWWRTDARGLEHGVTIAERADGEGPLVLALDVDGLTPSGEESIALSDGDAAIARYAGLSVLDARGTQRPATMSARGGRVVIEVDDSHARYPLVVDPLVFVLEATLGGGAGAGTSVAMTPDGMRTIVGGSSGAGVYLRTGSTWTAEATLAGAAVGAYVSISADGATAVTSSSAAITVFTRSGTTWTAGVAPASPCATTIASISPDGTRLVAGTDHVLCAYRWTGAAWMLDYTFPYPPYAGTPTPAFYPNFQSVGWSGDGTRVAVGRPGNGLEIPRGSVDVFVVGSPWSLEQSVYDRFPAEELGTSVSLDTTGTRLMAGGAGYMNTSTYPPSVAFFARSGTMWNPEGPTFNVMTTGAARYSFPVTALSGNGEFGYYTVDSGTGAAFGSVVRSGTAWIADATYTSGGGVLPPGGLATTLFGTRVALGEPASHQTEVVHVALPVGYGCETNADCNTAFCVDGVCCASACGGGYVASGTNCSACAMRITGQPDGTCAALGASFAPNVTCRASAGGCDPAETCSPTTAGCPADVRAANGTTCRAATLACDVPEVCDGTSAVCPADAFAPTGMPCRAPSGLCDSPVCSGTSAQCPTLNVQPSGSVCRTSAGPCDPAETCDGVTTACPSNALSPVGTPCGSRPVSGVCDAPDVCTGTGVDCPDTHAVGVVCRAATGACDVAESCTGAGSNCPPDVVEGAGTVCRASTAACDPAESCDGTSTSCPADVDMCVAMPDSGTRDAGSITGDAGGTMSDAGAQDAGGDVGARDGSAGDASTMGNDAATTAPMAVGSCGCRAGASGSSGWLVVLGLLALRRVVRRERAARRPSA